MTPTRVLFLYPNINTELRIPLAISILVAVIRRAGHEVRLFDTTFMAEQFHTDDEAMAALGTHLPTNMAELVGELRPVDIKEELKRTIAEFRPDLVAVSLLERNFPTARALCASVKAEYPSLPVLVGGIMPTIAPEMVIGESWLDLIVVGEGEQPLLDVLGRWHDRDRLAATPNVWLKSPDGTVRRNALRSLIAMDDIPAQDWSDFDRRHALKPFMGKVYRGGPFEFSRGCSKVCTFCVAPQLRRVQGSLGRYHRTKTPARMIDEIKAKAREWDLTMLSFGDTDFLSSVPKPVMREFLTSYAREVALPFTIQSGAETLRDEETLRLLREARCCAISVGVESGSDRVRSTIIKKHVSKDRIREGFALCRKHGLRVTANYMIGVPFETEADVRETIAFNRELEPPSIAVMYFTPFVGTELYDISVREGFYEPFSIGSNSYRTTPLTMPQLPPDRIYALVEEFVSDFASYQHDFNPAES